MGIQNSTTVLGPPEAGASIRLDVNVERLGSARQEGRRADEPVSGLGLGRFQRLGELRS